MLDVRLVHLREEVLDAFVVPVVVHHQEPDLAGRHKRRNVPLIELVDGLQVHVVRLPLVLVHQVQGSMSYELVQMAVVFLLQRGIWSEVDRRSNIDSYLYFLCGAHELSLENGIVAVSDDGKVVAVRHGVEVGGAVTRSGQE